MKLSNTAKILVGIVLLMLLSPLVLNGQTYSFRNYGAENDIPSGFVYTVNQSSNGYLWVGTGNGLARFDGFRFYKVAFPDSSVGRYPNADLRDKNGTLWFGCNDGSLFYVRDETLVPAAITNTRSISSLIEGPDSMVYVIPQSRAVFSIDPDNPSIIRKYFVPDDPVMFSASFSAAGKLLIGAQGNIMICSLRNDSVIVEQNVEGFDYANITAIHTTPDANTFIVGTEDNGLFRMVISGNGVAISRFPDHPEWNTLNVQSVYEDDDNNFWISTFGSGVIQLSLADDFSGITSWRDFNIKSGLAGDDVKTVFRDMEGNYWMALYGEGISILTTYAFSYYTPGKNDAENNIIYISGYKDKYLLGTPMGFHVFDPLKGRSISFTNLSDKTGKVEISSYYLDDKDNLWFGTNGNGLFVMNSSGAVRLFLRTGDSGSDQVKDIEMDNSNIWLSTTNGIIVLDRATGNIKKRLDTNDGLPYSSINKILLSPKGIAYVGTESDRVYYIDRDFSVKYSDAVMSGNFKNKILSMTEDRNGALWLATAGNGVFRFQNDSIMSITKTNDLMSNFCYSILADSENEIWVGHSKGFSSYNTVSGIINVYGTEYAKGGICNPDALVELPDKKILIGTTEGFVVYDRTKDRKKEVPPLANINYITINDVRYPFRKSYTLPYRKYRIMINYTGIYFSNPEKVYYSTFLKNFDPDYSRISTSRQSLYSLGDGNYKFNLIAVNASGLSQDHPLSFSLTIKPPFWRTWWAIMIWILTLAAILVFIIRQRDKAQKKIQIYLEKELEARTRTVMKQKGEIELQNIEITDSINYAKRIQTSILPDINKLKEAFADAFILFHPRDIVSGDFYWFDRLDDERFILVCADSTGHGVPGAFMSMIGSTLLQDIVTRKRISKPSEVLTMLDKQIFSTLNQNVELGVSNDGMDMVVCEFNTKTRHIRFASAMRPVIIVLDGESYYIKGNRSSVGGESIVEKYYDDQEYYLSEGDIVYLFSDGLPDQFGGPDGKKMKIARLKKIIEQISKLPMTDQKETLSKFYFEWKGNYEQVDDILFMGVRV
ncbi:MAG TPA: two-component regulator propeller domain-containing protein [Bacteroidales bacterium]|nr:two-component regulator propeller domain-containing protein [Bacteroidales bacterium]